MLVNDVIKTRAGGNYQHIGRRSRKNRLVGACGGRNCCKFCCDTEGDDKVK